MAIIPKPQFPNIQQLPGVPQIARSPGFVSIAPTIGIAIAAAALWESFHSKAQWGIYKSKKPPKPTPPDAGIGTVTVTAKAPPRVPVVIPDSFAEFSYRNEWALANYPVEQGQFASFDKVASPFEIMVRMMKGGTNQARKTFLDSIKAIAGDLNFYDIITPEQTYLNVNVMRFEITRRGANGAFFLSEIDLYFQEVRSVSSTYTTTAVGTQNAKNPSAAPVTNTGAVMAVPITTIGPQ